MIEQHLILYDPDYNTIGHYERLKQILKNNFSFSFYKDYNEILKINFDNNIFYTIYNYVLKDYTNIETLVEIINSQNKSNINFVLNIWNIDDINKMIELKNKYNNIILISDGNIPFDFKNNSIIKLSPPLFSKNNSIKFNKNYLIDNYVLMSVWKLEQKNTKRWLSKEQILKIANILKNKNKNLLLIELGYNKIEHDNINIINIQDNIYSIQGKIENENIFLNIAKNADYSIIFSDGEYYKYRSSGKIADFLYHNIKFITNLSIEDINNIDCNNIIKIKNLDDINNIDNIEETKSNILETTWMVENFKKMIYFLNFSNLIDNKKININGNGANLKEEYIFTNTPKLGMNVAYRYWEKHNCYPEIYVSLDDVLTKYHADNIHNMIINNNCKMFILHHTYFEKYPEDIQIEYVYNYDFLKNNIYILNSSPHITTGIMSVRLAIAMGFKHIIINGMDGEYINYLPETEKIEYNGKTVLRIKEKVISNPNYFFNEYQQKGDLYNIPNMERQYICNCNFHKKTLVDKPLHSYVKNVLKFDLEFYGIEYDWIENYLKINN